jgi:hypothetical protein
MMKQLKTLAKQIPVNFIRVGFNPETEQTRFLCLINGEGFDFHCGLFACIPATKTRKSYNGETITYKPLEQLERKLRMCSSSNKEHVFKMIRAGRVHARNNMQQPHVLEVFQEISALCQPEAYDLLYCLQSDCQAADGSFADFCANFGYDDDSIKALNTYNACCEGAKKLRKALGPDLYAEVMAADPE